MFFILSKLFWILAQPLSLLAIALLLIIVFVLRGMRRTAAAFAVVSFAALLAVGYTTLGAAMIAPLEDRFSRPAAMPEEVAAIVVLGGGFDGKVSNARGIAELRASGDRFVEAVALARLYPQAMVVVSGGFGSLVQEGDSDATIAERFYPRLGLGLGRLVVEGESRNTAENAAEVASLVGDRGGRVLLVTSAFHMPRSVALFRRAGFEVVPWPVDYRSSGMSVGLIDFDNPVENLFTVTTAMREWIGLVAYWMTGQIESPFPEGEP